MQFLLIRQIWMLSSLLLATAITILFIYVGNRPSPLLEDEENRQTWFLEDNRRPFYYDDIVEAMNEVPSPFESMHKLDYVRPLGTAPRWPLDKPFPDEQREALSEFLNNYAKALQLTDAIGSKPASFRGNRRYQASRAAYSNTFGSHNKFMLVSPQDIKYYFHRLRYNRYDATGGLKNFSTVSQLLSCAALDAVLKENQQEYLLIMEKKFKFGSSVKFSVESVFGSIHEAFSCLESVEEGVNRLNLDPHSLTVLRQMLRIYLFDRLPDLCMTYKAFLANYLAMMQYARDTARIPPQNRGNIYRDNFFGHTFEGIMDTWLSAFPLQQQYQIHYLRNAIRLGNYSRYGGMKSLVLSDIPDLNAQRLRLYLAGESNDAFSSLLNKDSCSFSTLLTPYMENYEPYTIGLAYYRAAETGIAVCQYHQEKGIYPDSLEDLIPDFMAAVPVDPYTENTPLKYRNESDRITIYSIGTNKADDNGFGRYSVLQWVEMYGHKRNCYDIPFVVLKKGA